MKADYDVPSPICVDNHKAEADAAEEALPSLEPAKLSPVKQVLGTQAVTMDLCDSAFQEPSSRPTANGMCSQSVDQAISATAPSMYPNLYQNLDKSLLEAADAVSPLPSAPAAVISDVMHHLEVDLPRDLISESVVFPSTLEDCVAKVFEEQQQLSDLKPFTAEQLRTFYENELLQQEATIVESFLDCRKNLETHPLYECLASFLRCRVNLQNTLEELNQLNKDIEAAASQLWTVAAKKVVNYGECSDGKRVKAQDEFPVAHFDRKAAAQVVRQLKQQREKIQETLALCVYESNWWKLKVDFLICGGLQLTDHGKISVIFAFLRRPIKDRTFVDHLKCWLQYITVSLFKKARKEDYLFLAHHILRCPAGLARWGPPFLQVPSYDLSGDDEEGNIHHIDVVLALLSALCQPVSSRQEFLQNWVDQQDQENHWVWLDSEGEDEEGDAVNMSDDDLLALLNQIPVANVFRFAFRLRQRDQVDVLARTFQVGQWLRAFALCRHLLTIFETGLRTYQGLRYKNLAKKLGQLVLHTVCNVAEVWKEHWKESTDNSMKDRLQREYEHVVLEGLTILIRTRQQRSWQLLSRLPLSGLTLRIRLDVWLRWHSDICDEAVELESIQTEPFWNLLSSKLVQLPEPDWFVFLVTLSAMASDDSTRTENHFLQLIVWELTELGLINEATQELCFKTIKDLLITLATKHPALVSFVLERLKRQQPAAALAFFKELPMSQWRPTGADFQLLRDWLLDGPLDSVRHQLAVTVLTRLNWMLENGVKPFLGVKIHQEMALLLVEVVIIHSRLPVPSAVPAMASNFLADSVQFLSSFSRSWNSANLVQWAWHVILKLRLHTLDCYPEHLLWMLHHPQKAFRAVRQFQDDPQLQVLRQNVALPFSCFVALSMTSVGHSLPEFCSTGVDFLSTLSAADQHRPVVAVLHNLFPLLVTSPDILYNQPKLLDVFQRLIQADNSYYKRAKNLLAPQFPGEVLLMVGSLVESTIWKLNG